jgi:cytochrome bd ubiquinol oxidase subunit II
MTVVDGVAAALFVGVVAYALFGGADFGSGFWDLTAGNAKRGGPLRSLIDHSIGPVWEANHVWLVFILVYLWTGFPMGFGAVMTTLPLPLTFAAVGITLRGAGFAFRKFSSTLGYARLFGAIFASSSVVTPFFLGTVAGAVASGRVPAAGNGDRWTSWTGPASLLGGVLAVLTCAFLAGVFLLADAARANHNSLAEQLRPRVIAVGIITGAVVLGGALPLRSDAPTLFNALNGRGLPLVVASALAGVVSLAMLIRRRYALARMAAVAAVGAVVIGWGVAQYPWFSTDQLRLSDTAGAHPTLIGLLIVFALAVAIVIPSLAWLYRLVNQEEWSQ